MDVVTSRYRGMDGMGFVPSLEALPYFGVAEGREVTEFLTYRPQAYSSYGNITRDLLTGQLAAGVLPFEIFVHDLLGLPGQMDQWIVMLFLHPCPTELVFGRLGYGMGEPNSVRTPKGSGSRLPRRLTIGVESRSSLTQQQVSLWLSRNHSDVKLAFSMLPMELMGKALKRDEIDGIVVPTPWGLKAEVSKTGLIEKEFVQGRFVQDLVMVGSRKYPVPGQEAGQLARVLKIARKSFDNKEAVDHAAIRMAGHGRPVLANALFHDAIDLHPSFLGDPDECVPDKRRMLGAFVNLETCSPLPRTFDSIESAADKLL